jgi:CheY-like chemotaxis protein
MNVLIVEDQTDHRELIALLLARKGYAIRSAATVDEGLAALRSQLFDVVLLDIMMPGKDGYSFLREFKTLAQTPPPRVVALTALGMRDDRDRLLASGCEKVITKPVSADELRRVLESMEENRG